MKENTIYEILFKESSVVMFLLDPETGEILDANKSALNFYGYSLSQMKKMSIFDINILPPNDVRTAMANVLSGNQKSFTFKHKLKNGEIRNVSVEASPLNIEGKKYIFSIIKDISDKLKLEYELKLSESRFRSYVEKSPISVIIVDYKGYINYANPAAVKLIADGNSITGRKAGRFGAGDDEKKKAAFYADLIKIQKEVLFEYCIRDGEGNNVYLIIKAVRLTDDENILFCLDITERKKYEMLLLEEKKRAEAASRAKSDFLSNISHELKTPLNGIIGFTELLKSVETNTEKNEMLSLIMESGETLNNLVNDVLNFVKIENNSIDEKISPFSMREFINGTGKIFALMAGKKGISFITDVSEDIPDFVCGNKSILQHIISNLLSNAVKYTEEGLISFSVKKGLEYNNTAELIFKITDTGIGIESDNLDRIFERFEREKNELTYKYSGLGLGLAIVKNLVQKCGGRISVESKKGGGSSFIVSLFFDISKPEYKEKRTVRKADKEMVECRILAADDDKTCRYILEKIITSHGWTADIVDDGTKVLEAVNSTDYDIILLDINMPYLNGFETAKKLRDIGIKTPMIALTGYSSSKEYTEWQQAGMDYCIAKPINRKSFYNTIELILENRME